MELTRLKNRKAKEQAIKANRVEFVKEKSKPKTDKEISLNIVNCSRGEINIGNNRLQRDLNSYNSSLQLDALPYAI